MQHVDSRSAGRRNDGGRFTASDILLPFYAIHDRGAPVPHRGSISRKADGLRLHRISGVERLSEH